jgi:hypothetical protein
MRYNSPLPVDPCLECFLGVVLPDDESIDAFPGVDVCIGQVHG